MKKYAIFGLMALACFSLKAAPLELDGMRYAGYTTNAVPAGFSILAVPFSGFDTNSFTSTNLSLNALISTNGLTTGDRLIVFNETTTNYYYYALTGTGWNPLAVAEIGTGSTNFVKIITGDNLSTVLKAKGYAFWLKSQNPTTAQLQGIVDTNLIVIAIAENAFTLIGNALPTALELNSDSFTNNTWFTAGPPSVGDEVYVVSGTNYLRNIYYNGSWQYAQQTTTNTVLSPASQIPAGAGVWFRRRGSSQNLILK
jgi:hypothetical protein